MTKLKRKCNENHIDYLALFFWRIQTKGSVPQIEPMVTSSLSGNAWWCDVILSMLNVVSGNKQTFA